MRLDRGLLSCALLLSTALVVRADGISPSDPKIIVGRGTGSTLVTALQFVVPVDLGGGGIFNFDNATGQDWIGLILTVNFKNAADAKAAAVSCSSDLFSTCSPERHGKILTITLTGGEITPCSDSSCSMDSEFFVDLNDGATLHSHGKANGNGGWKKDIIEGQIIGQAIPAPEPAVLPLLLSGLGGIWLWRKRGFHPGVNT
jgi:hypothetical protein